MNLALDLPSTAPMSSDFSSDAAMNSSLDELRSAVDHRLTALRPSRTPVLQQLRSQYPNGCLFADLVQVNSEQFVVRASVQVDGTTIVTALASATTVEVAEDRARSRALEALGLNVGHSSVSASLSATVAMNQPMIQEIAPELTIPPVMQSLSEPTEKTAPRTATKRKAKVQPVEPISEAPTLDLLTIAPIEAVVAIEEAAAVVEPIAEPKAVLVTEPEVMAVAEPEVTAEPEVIAVAEPEVIVEPVAVVEPVAAPIVEVEESFEISYESEEVFEYTYEEPAAEPVVEAPAPVKAPVATPATAIDLSDTIAQIGMEIDRIGWTKKQGSAYLQQEYSKRTRAELTEAELFSFLGYLKSLPAKLQPELSQIPF